MIFEDNCGIEYQRIDGKLQCPKCGGTKPTRMDGLTDQEIEEGRKYETFGEEDDND